MQKFIYTCNSRVKIHEEILTAVRRLCAERRNWRFTPAEVVHALPHLNERSVRTHIVSRCCVNAPSHHAHRWPYFKRLRRGLYEVMKDYRASRSQDGPGVDISPSRVAEAPAPYDSGPAAARSVIHAVVVESEGRYVADCLEVPVVTQGASLDELLGNLREALDLYMSGEDPVLLGLAPRPRLLISFETTAHVP